MDDLLRTGLADFFQTEYLLPVGSGTAGISLALQMLPSRRRHVILPVATCPNIIVAILAAGAIPVPVDIQPEDFNLSPQEAARNIDADTGAVLAVDSFGYPADVGALRQALPVRQVLLIEDACQAYGGSEAGIPLGNRGDIGIVSFGHSKPLQLGGGGLLMTRSREIFKELSHIAGHALTGTCSSMKNMLALKLMKNGHYRLFTALSRHAGLLNYRFPPRQLTELKRRWRDFACALTTLRELSTQIAALVARIPCARPFAYTATRWLPWRYSFSVPGAATRERTIKELHRHGIATSCLYRPLDEFFRLPPTSAGFRARQLADEIINLNYPVNINALTRLVQRLRSFMEKAGTGEPSKPVPATAFPPEGIPPKRPPK